MILPKQRFQALLHLLTCSESADLDEGRAPSRDDTDIIDAPTFQVEERDDQPVGGGKIGEKLFHDLARFQGLLGRDLAGVRSEVLDDLRFGLGKIGVAQLGADAFAVELVEAGVDVATEYNGLGLSAGAWYGAAAD